MPDRQLLLSTPWLVLQLIQAKLQKLMNPETFRGKEGPKYRKLRRTTDSSMGSFTSIVWCLTAICGSHWQRWEDSSLGCPSSRGRIIQWCCWYIVRVFTRSPETSKAMSHFMPKWSTSSKMTLACSRSSSVQHSRQCSAGHPSASASSKEPKSEVKLKPASETCFKYPKHTPSHKISSSLLI